jgi:hypothetical protein
MNTREGVSGFIGRGKRRFGAEESESGVPSRAFGRLGSMCSLGWALVGWVPWVWLSLERKRKEEGHEGREISDVPV